MVVAVVVVLKAVGNKKNVCFCCSWNWCQYVAVGLEFIVVLKVVNGVALVGVNADYIVKKSAKKNSLYSQ